MRRQLTALVALVGLCACAGTSPVEGPCPLRDAPSLEIGLREGAFGLSDDTTVPYGMPPQGGAPFAPFRVRAWGVAPDPAGFHVVMIAVDSATGDVIGSGDYVQGFVCANVGESAGARVAPELHMRFYDLSLDELQGRAAELRFHVDAGEETLASAFSGVLDWSL